MHAVFDTFLWVQLQRLDQLVGDGRAMADGCGAVERGVGGEAAGARSLSYSAGISACEKGRHWQRALSLLSEMWEAKLVPNFTSYSAGIPACDRCGQWQQAIWLLKETWTQMLGPMSVASLTPESSRYAGKCRTNSILRSTSSGKLHFPSYARTSAREMGEQ
ncbi:unnamed protein product [Prorocentrum cordatum]|uniref:Pentatricopeptide repeat-containing protein n=1 Tax=Prorocentrum cordatum TaxID=2364126 RepID=A0ABN9RCP2_9DINO|nr:unnamed protein product [Polarella glacialis]